MFDIHPSAKENFNSNAYSLIKLVKEIPRKPNTNPSFSDIHIATTITENDITGPIREAESDYKGNTTGRFFTLEDKRYGLNNSDYITLAKLAESIQKNRVFRKKLSQDFIEESIFSWLEESFKGKEDQEPYIETLLKKSLKSIERTIIQVPIANTIVEDPFEFCGVKIKNIEKTDVDKIVHKTKLRADEEANKNIDIFFEEFRNKYQGYAAIEFKIECEPKYALKLTLEESNIITNLLGIYSAAILSTDTKCVAKAKGLEGIPEFTNIIKDEKEIKEIKTHIVDYSYLNTWYITKSELKEYSKRGISIISNIYTKEKPTDFESSILSTALLYSKSAFTSEPIEKLVYMLSALEATLLRSDNEPIQQNVSERMARLTYESVEDRKSVIRNFKRVYSLRSKYLHHGQTIGETEELSSFFINMWVFFNNLLQNSANFESKERFLNVIDDLKLR